MGKKLFFIIFVLAIALFALGYRAALERKEAAEEKNIGLERSEKQETGKKFIVQLPSACLDDGAGNRIDGVWPAFQGSFFSVKYPAGFQALERNVSDYGFFRSPDQKVIFGVYAPQWTGEPERISVQAGEEALSDEEEEIKIDCETELGSGAVQKIRRFTVRDKNGGYEREVIDIRLVGPENSGETRKVFSFRYDSAESFKKNKAGFEKFMRSLEQLAD